MAQRLPRGTDLRIALWRAAKAVDALDRESIAATGLNPTDFAVLELLFALGPQPASRIARKVMLTSGSTTTAIDRLEGRGLVTRRGDESDRRRVVVDLTPDGRALIRDAFDRHARTLDGAFSGLDLAEKRTLFGLLAKVRRSCSGSAACHAEEKP